MRHVVKVSVLVLCSAMIFGAHARRNERNAPVTGSAETSAILPQIDVIRVKESADEALRVTDDLRREIERLNARNAELDNRLVLLSEEVSRAAAAKIEELETRLALLTEAYKDLHLRTHALELAITPVPRPAPQVEEPQTFTVTPAGIVVASPEYELYQRALRLFNARSFENALETFKQCAELYSDGQFRDRVRFWIAESYYQLGNFEQALVEYRAVLAIPNAVMADAAQFQIALAHQRLGQTERARAEFRRLIDRYPASTHVERARQYLESLR